MKEQDGKIVDEEQRVLDRRPVYLVSGVAALFFFYLLGAFFVEGLPAVWQLAAQTIFLPLLALLFLKFSTANYQRQRGDRMWDVGSITWADIPLLIGAEALLLAIFVAINSLWGKVLTFMGMDLDLSGANLVALHESGLPLLVAALGMICVAPVAEEFIFRRFIYRGLKGRIGGSLAAAVTMALLFAIMHFSLYLAPSLLIFALVLQYFAEKRSLLFAIILHTLNNLVAFTILAFSECPGCR